MNDELVHLPELAALSWRNTGVLLPAAGVLVAIVLSVALFYPRQLRAVPRLWRWILPLVRALALLALAVSVLKPVVLRPKGQEEQGAVVFLVDRSRSMGVKDLSSDTERGQAQLVELADALRRLPAGARAKSVAGLAEQVQRVASAADDAVRLKNELEYARMSGRETAAAVDRLDRKWTDLTQSAREAQAQAAKLGAASARELDNLWRMAERTRSNPDAIRVQELVQRVRDETQRSQATFDAELYRTNGDVRKVCAELAGLSRLQLVTQALCDAKGGVLAKLDSRTPVAAFAFAGDLSPLPLKAGATVESLKLDAAGSATDIAGAIRAAMQRLSGRPVQAIVVLSDGRETIGGSVQAGGLPENVPVFVVPAAASGVRDLSFMEMSAPASQFVAQPVTVRIVPRLVGINPWEIKGDVKLTVNGAAAGALPIRIKDGRCEPLEFQVKVDQPGIARIAATLPSQKGEASFENNQAERWVKIISQQVKVLLLSGSPGWEHRHLRDTLERAPWVEMREVMLDAPGAKLAMGSRQMLQQDVLVLNDVAADALDDEQWDAVRKLVSEQGGSVILVSGDAHLPSEYADNLLDLLPYRGAGKPVWRVWPGEEPYYRAEVAPGARTLDALKLSSDVEESRRRWSELRGFYRYLEMPPLKPDVRALLVERESRLPMLTEEQSGRGRIFFLAVNETWRWRSRGDRDHERFWLQFMRYAAEAPYAVSDAGLFLDCDRLIASPAEPLHVRAKFPADVVGATDMPQVRIVRDGHLVRSEAMRPTGAAGGVRYEADVKGLTPGDYALYVDEGGEARLEGISLPVRIMAGAEAEMADISGDEAKLSRLAAASGGKVLPLSQIGSLPRMLQEQASRRVSVSEMPLWDSAYLYSFVLACLAGEWAIRKRFGLA